MLNECAVIETNTAGREGVVRSYYNYVDRNDFGSKNQFNTIDPYLMVEPYSAKSFYPRDFNLKYTMENRLVLRVSHIIIEGSKHRVSNGVTYHETAGPVLIDGDYNFPIAIYMINTTSKPRGGNGIGVYINIHYRYDDQLGIPNYRLNFFFQDHYHDENTVFGYTKIKKLSTSSPGANGIDITFARDFLIYPKGIVTLLLPLCGERSIRHYPHLFIMRSKYARQGIAIAKIFYDDDYNLSIIISNESTIPVDLGHKFIQMVLPAPLCSNITLDMLERIAGVDKDIISNNIRASRNTIEVQMKENDRKIKEDDFLF